jgi:hypothetical protein
MSSGHAEPIRGFSIPVETVAAPPARQAWHLLHFAFAIVPLLAGIDKFFHYLTNWDQYAAPWVVSAVPFTVHTVMLTAGIIEIVAGLIVAFWPRIGAWVIFAWLCVIIVNLLAVPSYYDIALRDAGLALGAAALARLSVDFESRPAAQTVTTPR